MRAIMITSILVLLAGATSAFADNKLDTLAQTLVCTNGSKAYYLNASKNLNAAENLNTSRLFQIYDGDRTLVLESTVSCSFSSTTEYRCAGDKVASMLFDLNSYSKKTKPNIFGGGEYVFKYFKVKLKMKSRMFSSELECGYKTFTY